MNEDSDQDVNVQEHVANCEACPDCGMPVPNTRKDNDQDREPVPVMSASRTTARS